LRNFRADEILLVGTPDQDGGLEASLRKFGIPVTRLGGSLPLRERDRVREGARRIAAGRSRATPFVFFAGVNLALLLLAVLISLVEGSSLCRAGKTESAGQSDKERRNERQHRDHECAGEGAGRPDRR
jgi:hypothetical protein